MPYTDSFQQFTSELAEKIQAAKQVGLSEHDIKKKVDDVAQYLAQHADVKNPEQRVLKEMWNVADDNEKHSLASCLYKLVERTGRPH